MIINQKTKTGISSVASNVPKVFHQKQKRAPFLKPDSMDAVFCNSYLHFNARRRPCPFQPTQLDVEEEETDDSEQLQSPPHT